MKEVDARPTAGHGGKKAMPLGLHHVVHAVRDLDAAAERYRALGFQVGGRNAHPWGTENRIVQLAGSYIELLSVAAPEKIPEHADGRFSFGAFTRDFLRRREGLCMIALASADARADEAAYRAAGIGDFDVFDFAREGKRPDGTPVRLAFSLAFARDGAAPAVGFFACQEHFPENFWNPEFQRHRNSASAIAEVVLVAENPASHAPFLSAFAGREASVETASLSVPLPRGGIRVLTPATFGESFGIDPSDTTRPHIAAACFAVQDLTKTAAALQPGGILHDVRGDGVVVGPQAGMGTAFAFIRH
jgi:catechol 2,3-dioxygenase-like lactoylglutathione lyase family enzyme